MRRICPKCGNNTFITSAHVMQDWEVDAEGNYLDTVSQEPMTKVTGLCLTGSGFTNE